MRAAVLNDYGKPLDIEDVAAPDVWATGVRVRIDATGVCHSDLLIQDGSIPFPLPVILGHEGAGTVLEVGESVTRVSVGDRVICSFLPACGSCWYCLRGRSNLCEGLIDTMLTRRGTRADGTMLFGMSGLGTFADELVTDQGMVVPVQTDLPAEQLALIGCGVTTGVGAALNTAQVQPGSSVAVFGCGGVGQAVIQGARIAGAARIFAVDPLETKRSTAAGFGATDLIDPAVADPVEQIREATGGRGTEYAFEVIGTPETVTQAYAATCRGGTAVVIGMPPTDATVTFEAVELMANDKKLSAGLRQAKLMRRLDQASLPVPDGVSVESAMAAVNDRVPVRIVTYDRAERTRPTPALLWIHGGGTVIGRPEQDNRLCGRWADELGLLVVGVDHRLAPEHPFPAPLEDCFTALQWLHDHAAELGVDRDRIAVGGNSAGGLLAASLCQQARDEGLHVCFQLLEYPMLDDRTVLRRFDRSRSFVWSPGSSRFGWTSYLGGPVREQEDRRYAVPTRTPDLEGLPPTWIGVGDIDLLHDEAVAYADALRRADVPCELHVMPGMYHGADAIRPKAPTARAFVDVMTNALARGMDIVDSADTV